MGKLPLETCDSWLAHPVSYLRCVEPFDLLHDLTPFRPEEKTTVMTKFDLSARQLVSPTQFDRASPGRLGCFLTLSPALEEMCRTSGQQT